MDIQGVDYTLTSWLMCNHCSRAYISADELVDHKKKRHARQFYKSFPRKCRRSKRHIPANSGKENIECTVTTSLPTSEEGSTEVVTLKRIQSSTSSTCSTDNGGSLASTVSGSHSISGESSKSTHDDDDDNMENTTEDVNTSPEPIDNLKEATKEITKSSCPLPPLSKKSANAFRILFDSSLKMKELAQAGKSSYLKLRSSARNRSNNLTSVQKDSTTTSRNHVPLTTTGTFSCPHCPRQLTSEGTLKLHIKLHKSIIINSDPNSNPKIPCKMCGKILDTPPYKCIDCSAMKMVMEFPPVIIKNEPMDREDSFNIADEFIDDLLMDVDSSASLIKEAIPKEKPEKSETSKMNANDETVYNCGFCQESFTDAKIFRAHHESTHATNFRIYNCKICNRGFNNRGNRNAHEKSHESSTKPTIPTI